MGTHLTICLIISWIMAHPSFPAQAEPFVPTDDRQVLERLSLRAADPTARQIRTLRTALNADPANVDLAAHLAARYVELGRAEGDPRFLGRAQAVLSRWWHDPAPPPRVLLLRAVIRQNAHEFDSALADLDALLRLQPADAQAWLTKASILQVQGRYEEARQACRPLARLAARHVALTCLNDVAGMTGQTARGRAALSFLAAQPGLPERERLWVLTVLAELSARIGLHREAEASFAQAHRLGIRDQYLLGAYADFLLDRGRPQEVLALLAGETRPDGLLLRLALAEQALGRPKVRDHIAELAARFAAGRTRGSAVHLREEARFTLTLLGEPLAALALAQANWAVQKEPWDARLLLESALAAGKPKEAAPVLEWLKNHRVEDRRLAELAAALP
jgi:tetratricopeptide (TPR) repeat protein